MSDFLQNLVDQFVGQTEMELIAVITGFAYIILASRGSLWCWPAGFISSALFVYVFWQAGFLLDSILNGYYVAMAVYGWWQWQQPQDGQSDLPITEWSGKWHALILVGGSALALLVGWAFSQIAYSSLPYLDAFTTIFSFITTYLLAKKVASNWLYWVAIDFVAIFMYIYKGLNFTAVLFAVYVVIAAVGYFDWQRKRKLQTV